MQSQKNAALAIITERLVEQSPVIVHDAHDSGDHLLMLKGLTKATLDKDSRDPEVMAELQTSVAKFFKSIEPVLPFLVQNDLLSQDFELDMLHLDGRQITGIIIPDEKAVTALTALYEKSGITNPFAKITTGSDKGLVDFIVDQQGLNKNSIGGIG